MMMMKIDDDGALVRLVGETKIKQYLPEEFLAKGAKSGSSMPLRGEMWPAVVDDIDALKVLDLLTLGRGAKPKPYAAAKNQFWGWVLAPFWRDFGTKNRKTPEKMEMKI